MSHDRRGPSYAVLCVHKTVGTSSAAAMAAIYLCPFIWSHQSNKFIITVSTVLYSCW